MLTKIYLMTFVMMSCLGATLKVRQRPPTYILECDPGNGDYCKSTYQLRCAADGSIVAPDWDWMKDSRCSDCDCGVIA